MSSLPEFFFFNFFVGRSVISYEQILTHSIEVSETKMTGTESKIILFHKNITFWDVFESDICYKVPNYIKNILA